jgi:uncharacterized protein YndB with AHSA1/START domain
VTEAGKSSFIYVIYIRTTPECLWSALTGQEFARQYWRGAYPDADWKMGGAWKLVSRRPSVRCRRDRHL